MVVGDITRPETLSDAVQGVDAVVFTHGSNGSKADMEAVDYGGVRNVLTALGDQPARVALMTLIGITNRSGSYNRSTEGPDWKRRSERLVRASGRPYTIVRPGWFDYNASDEQMPVFLQGDLRRSGGPDDGAVSRRQIARVLIAGLATDAANRKTFELVAAQGEAPSNLEPLFVVLDSDEPNSLEGVRDEDNMPLSREPARVRDDLEASSRSEGDGQPAPREEVTMKNVIVAIGPGQSGQAIARRVGVGKHVLLADLRQDHAAFRR